MVNFDVEKIRNVAVISHGGAGKTSLTEALLLATGSIERAGSVSNGTSTTDFEPEEIARKITTTSALAFCTWKNHRINLIDTPGFINFIEDTRGSLKAVDGAVVIASALSGVKAETEKVWQYACEFEIPRVIFINKMDKDNANFSMAMAELEKSFATEAIPLIIPIGAGNSFSGVIDIVRMKASALRSGQAVEAAIPSELMAEAEACRKKLIEKIVEADDQLLEKYLDGRELTTEEILRALREGALTKKFIPVACGSANRNIGIPELLNIIILCLPSPSDMARISPVRGKNLGDGKAVERKVAENEPFSAYVFKTISDPYAGKLSLFRVYSGILRSDSSVFNTANGTKERVGQIFYLLGKKHIPVQMVGPGEIGVVAKLKNTNTGDTLSDEAQPILFEKLKFAEPLISYAIAAKSKGDEDRVSTGLHKILEEDPTLWFHRDEETGEMLLSGMGQVHLEVTLEKLKRKFGAEVIMKTPKIPYRETIKLTVKTQGRYKKQSGGKGQYGDCWIEIEPLPRGGGFEFLDKIVGGVIPRQYIPAVEKGIVEAMHEGVAAGYPLVDLKVTLYDGSYHTVDSSEMAFKIAGSMALKKAVQEARPVLLEPLMRVEITAPDEALGAVIGDLNSKRGKVQGVEPQAGRNEKITALVPMSEMLTYANQLQGLTSGRGLYSMEFSHYEELPGHLTQKIIAEKAAKKTEA